MWQLAAIIIGIALLDLASVALEHQGGTRAVLGGLLGLAGGFASGFFGALILGLMVIPGACVAVLCPMCYREPAADQVLRAGLVYFTLLGIVSGLVPGTGFRAGFGLGAGCVVLQSADYWLHYGAGPTILLGVLLAAVGWSIHRVLAERLDRGPGASRPPGGPEVPPSVDFWDGASWRIPPSGGASVRPAESTGPHS